MSVPGKLLWISETDGLMADGLTKYESTSETSAWRGQWQGRDVDDDGGGGG